MSGPSGSAPRIINGQPFGAWVVKSNPAISDIVAVLDDGGAGITGWCLQRNYRSRLIAPGDPVYLWVSGGSKTVASGFWGVGVIGNPPVVEDDLDDDQPRVADVAAKPALSAHLTLAVAENPVTRIDCKADPVLAEIEVLRVSQIGNPSFLTPEQHDRLSALMPVSLQRGP
jgi:hypothetical protein